MKVEIKELKWITVESNILTKYSKSKDKQKSFLQMLQSV